MIRLRFLLVLVAAGSCLVILSPGCDELITEKLEITIAGHPTADFRILKVPPDTPGDSGCLINGAFPVKFEDHSTGPIGTYIWNFGDTSKFDTIEKLNDTTDGDIVHTYTTTGSFTVILTVIDSLDPTARDDEVKQRAVIVGHDIDSIRAVDTVACPGTEVRFIAYNPFGVDSMKWNFGDGSPILNDTTLSLEQVHVYSQPGTYVVSLTTRGECPTSTPAVRDTVHIIQCAEPMFTMTPSDGCVPLAVEFLDTTPAVVDTSGNIVGVAVDWRWEFGNGSASSSQDASFTYQTAGTYEVTFSITTDVDGMRAVSSSVDTIKAHPSTGVNFTVSDSIACQAVPGRQFIVKFTRESSGEVKWLWDFGDGFTSVEQSPIHGYSTPGTYDVKLIIRGACGTDSLTDSSVVLRNNLIEFSDMLQNVAFGIAPDAIDIFKYTFSDMSPGAVVHREWDFGDTSTNPTGSVVIHTYDSAKLGDSVWVKLSIFNTCNALADSAAIEIGAR